MKITLVQGSGLAKTKSSRILKNTTTAVYNEAVMFIFNPTKAELAHTKITISVHDMQRFVFILFFGVCLENSRT